MPSPQPLHSDLGIASASRAQELRDDNTNRLPIRLSKSQVVSPSPDLRPQIRPDGSYSHASQGHVPERHISRSVGDDPRSTLVGSTEVSVHDGSRAGSWPRRRLTDNDASISEGHERRMPMEITFQVLPANRTAMVRFSNGTNEQLTVHVPGDWAMTAARGADEGLSRPGVDKYLRQQLGVDGWSTRVVVLAFYGAPSASLQMPPDIGAGSARDGARAAAPGRPAGTPVRRIQVFEEHGVAEAKCGDVALQAPQGWALMVAKAAEDGLDRPDVEEFLSEETGMSHQCAALLIAAFYGIPSDALGGIERSPSPEHAPMAPASHERGTPDALLLDRPEADRPRAGADTDISNVEEQGKETSVIGDTSYLHGPLSKTVFEMAKLRIPKPQLVRFILERHTAPKSNAAARKEHDQRKAAMAYMTSMGSRLPEDPAQQRPLNQAEAELLADHAIAQVPPVMLALPVVEGEEAFDWKKYDLQELDVPKKTWARMAEAARNNKPDEVANIVERTMLEYDTDVHAWVREYVLRTYTGV